ncbi:hypothetical protein QOZ80_1BG0086930 [Eleusine coracana subsp. coracana]|nr:hypothetical protein QOZ80_1BG0086930 [Eleusine coracana subsp. coracana]
MLEVDDTPAPPLGQPPPTPPWSELDANLLSRIAGLCALKDYNASRIVCHSWHAALPPPLSNPLAVLPAADGTSTSHHPVSLAVCFLHARRWCRLPGLGPHQPSTSITTSAAGDCRCVGARDDDGWVALVSAGTAETGVGADGRAALFNPFTGEEIALDAALLDPAHNPAPKIVFSPHPTRNSFAAVSLCRPTRLAVQRSCGAASFTTVEDTCAFLDGAVLVDVAYNDRDGGGAVYCLSAEGHVYVVRFNRRRRGCGGRCLSVVEVGTLLLEPADEFPPPYDAIARLTGAKNLVLSDDGALYHVWRRPAGAGTADVDAPPWGSVVTRCGGRRRKPGRVYEGDVFVLRHDPTSWPHWTVVDDLGGAAFFIGMNGAAVVRGGDGGVHPNCVYYWESVGEGEYEPVVYSVATGSSVRWPAATGGISSPVWYFLPEQQRQSVDVTDLELTIADEEEASCMQYDEEDDPADSVPDRFRSKQTMNMFRNKLHPMNLHEGVSGISTSLVTLDDDQIQDFF